MDTQTLKGCIFDADGTLLDSMPVWVKADQVYLSRHGVRATPELSREMFAMTMSDITGMLKERFGIKDTPDKIAEDIKAIVADFYAREVGLKPGMEEFLSDLKEKNIPMMICTSNDKALIDAALDHLGINGLFVKVLTCDEAHTDKSSPAIYDMGARMLGQAPEHVMVFEDALHALESAKAGGFLTCGVFDAYSAMYEADLRRMSDVFIKTREDFKKLSVFFKIP